MKEKDILVSLDMAKDEYIEEASPENERVKRKIRNRFEWIQLALPVAACLCIACVGTLLFTNGGINSTTSSHDFPHGDIPLLEYTAEQVADMVNGNVANLGINYYDIEIYDSDKFVAGMIKDNINPDTKYYPVYEDAQYDGTKGDRGEKLFKKYEDVIDRFSEQAGVSCDKQASECYDDQPLFRFYSEDETEEFYGYIISSDIYEIITIYDSNIGSSDYVGYKSLKNGELSIDWNRTDEELIKDVEWMKKDFFAIFGREFSDVAIERSCWYDNNNVTVIFYDKNDFESGLYPMYGDNIRLSFKCDDDISEGKMYMGTAQYYDYNLPATELRRIIGMSSAISLEEAEELLAKGYVFLAHSCEKCIEENNFVDDISDYDYVQIEYLSRHIMSYDTTGRDIGYPFYTFYKKFGETESGRVTYAVARVCAIKLTGYEEYFANQAKYHR